MGIKEMGRRGIEKGILQRRQCLWPRGSDLHMGKGGVSVKLFEMNHEGKNGNVWDSFSLSDGPSVILTHSKPINCATSLNLPHVFVSLMIISLPRQIMAPYGRLRHVTVLLNPAAGDNSSRKQFEKNVAPLLHLAGLDVHIVKTEFEGQVG